MYTLLVEALLPDNEGIMRDISTDRWYLGVIFCVFIFVAALTVMNMLIGIIVDMVGKISAVEKERNSISFLKGKMEDLLLKVDANFDGRISKAEYLSIVNNDEALSALRQIGVDVV